MDRSKKSDQILRGNVANGRNGTSEAVRGYEHTPFAAMVLHQQQSPMRGTNKTKLQMMSPPSCNHVSSTTSHKRQCCSSLKEKDDSFPMGVLSWNAMLPETARDSRVVTANKRHRSLSNEKPPQSPEKLRERSQSMQSPPPRHRSRTQKVDFGPWSPPRSTPALPVAPRDCGRPPLWSPPRDDSPRLPLFRSKFKKPGVTATVDHEPLAWVGVPTKTTASRSMEKHRGADRRGGAYKESGRPTRLFPTFDVSLDTWK